MRLNHRHIAWVLLAVFMMGGLLAPVLHRCLHTLNTVELVNTSNAHDPPAVAETALRAECVWCAIAFSRTLYLEQGRPHLTLPVVSTLPDSYTSPPFCSTQYRPDAGRAPPAC